MHNIKWDDLQFVLAVAQSGTLSAAARDLGVNHATVFRRIQAFESEAGVTLFERAANGYRVRPEARDVIDRLNGMADTAGQVARLLPTMGKTLEGAFRLTTTDSIADGLLARPLQTLARVHPRLSLQIKVSNAHLDLSRPGAEITLRPALELPEGLAGPRIADFALRIYGSAAYLAANPSDVVEDHRWLGVAPPLTRSPAGRWQEETLGTNLLLTSDSFLSLARLAEAGLGLAMLPSFLARQRPALRQAPMFDVTLTTGLWIATHRDLIDTPRVRAMIDFFAEALSAETELLR